MQLEIPERTNPNCYVMQMGFVYPICIWNRYDFLRARDTLAETQLGDYTNESYYTTAGRLKSFYQSKANCGWYAGQRRWRERVHPRVDFWLVFRSERDRTVAMMLING